MVLVAEARSLNLGDPPPAITYSLNNTNGGHDFRIDAVNGEVQTNATLDHSTIDVYLVCPSLSMSLSFSVCLSVSQPSPCSSGLLQVDMN